jgi:integrase
VADGKKERWEGGHLHVQKDGRRLYVIEKMVAGKRFHISTRATTPSAAYEHLKRFQADPWKYAEEMKEGREPDAGLFLTRALVLEFRDWVLHRPRPATPKHANSMAHLLADWTEDLAGRDLRKLELGHLKQQLARHSTRRQHRIIALKALCAWLRTEKHVLERRDDVTLDLKVPQGTPEKHKRRKAVEVERVRAVLPHLTEPYRDLLTLAAGTGWHLSELERFVRDEDAGIVYPKGEKVLAVLVTRHKSRQWTRTPVVDSAVLAAAERLRLTREVPRKATPTLKRACRAAGVEPFGFGVLRHSVATWAVEGGALPETVAAFLGHKDKSTTERFYADAAVPTAVVPLPKLRPV